MLAGSAMCAALKSGPAMPVQGVRRGHPTPGLVDLDLLQPIEIAQHISPFRLQAGLPAARVEFLAQDESQKRTKYVTADRGVRRVIDRPCAHQGLGGFEQRFYLDQIAIAEHRLQRRDAGVGAQHEDAVEAGFVGLPCRDRFRRHASPSDAETGDRRSYRSSPCRHAGVAGPARRSPPPGRRHPWPASASLRQTM